VTITTIKKHPPSSAQTMPAVRATDCDGKDYWFCSFGGNKIETYPGRYGYYCPGCNVIAPAIVRRRTFDT
jgi:hypothetical protein